MATSTESQNRPGRPALSSTPLFAVVGAADLAVRQVRVAAAAASSRRQQFRTEIGAALADVEKRVNAIDPKVLRAQAEAAYEELASRGKVLVDRVYTQTDTQALRTQAGNTLSRGKAAVTVARRAADDTASAIRGTITTARAEAGQSAGTVAETAVTLEQETVEPAVTRTRTSAKKTAATAAKSATETKTAAKGTRTSARKTAGTGTRAAKSAAKKVGD